MLTNHPLLLTLVGQEHYVFLCRCLKSNAITPSWYLPHCCPTHIPLCIIPFGSLIITFPGLQTPKLRFRFPVVTLRLDYSASGLDKKVKARREWREAEIISRFVRGDSNVRVLVGQRNHEIRDCVSNVASPWNFQPSWREARGLACRR